MPSINDPFHGVDFSTLPALSRFTARDGTRLAFRVYPAAGGTVEGSVVLVHGSAGSSSSMHVLAKAMAMAGYTAYALDIRGHGASGPKGTIAYIGQWEDDLEDFLAAVKPAHPITLAGFSSGGGFALRFAGSARQKLFDNYLLLSPLLGRKAPTFRPDSGGWVKIGLPRIIAISMLNAIGVRTFNGLPVLNFALDEQAKAVLTPHYSYNLALILSPGATTGPRSGRWDNRAAWWPARTTRCSTPSALPRCSGTRARMCRSPWCRALGISPSFWRRRRCRPRWPR